MWQKPSPSRTDLPHTMQCFCQFTSASRESPILIFRRFLLNLRPFNGILTAPFLRKNVRFLCFEPQIQPIGSTLSLSHARKQLMTSRITASLVLIAAMCVASARVASPACILVNMPSQKACAAACCANKSCCETSQKRGSEPVQPLATTSSQQQNLVAFTSLILTSEVAQPPSRDISNFSVTEDRWHSPDTLALICIRLI